MESDKPLSSPGAPEPPNRAPIAQRLPEGREAGDAGHVQQQAGRPAVSTAAGGTPADLEQARDCELCSSPQLTPPAPAAAGEDEAALASSPGMCRLHLSPLFLARDLRFAVHFPITTTLQIRMHWICPLSPTYLTDLLHTSIHT